MSKPYCVYCGRVVHRCRCADENSRIHQLLARQEKPAVYTPLLMDQPYKRGVPPQIKRRERYQLRKHYTVWFDQLVEQYGACCLNCGTDEDIVIDHVLSIAKGGKSEFANLQLLCRVCNRIKSKLNFDCRPADQSHTSHSTKN